MTRLTTQPRIFLLLALLLCVPARQSDGQSDAAVAKKANSYRVSLPVDEVELTFHAADISGLPVNDLKLDDLSLLDNGKPPEKILGFYLPKDHPIRAGILVDTSESMDEHRGDDQAVAIQYAQRVLRQQTDRAFVTYFGYISKITQDWTSDPNALADGVRKTVAGGVNPQGGTAIFDTIFRTCLYQFGDIDHAASGNFILLISDGEDNASHTSLQEAVEICQHSNTAIYAFHSEPKEGFSSGPGTLAELASKTGGRVFLSDGNEAGISDDLRIIEQDLLNQYRLVYKPADLKHDGSFHRINLITPKRVRRITVRSGYYAPAH